MKQKIGTSILFATLLVPCISCRAYANSSWHWVSANPLTILPWAILITLVIETVVICAANHIVNSFKAAIVILLANLVSFLAPYAFTGLFPDMHMEDLGFFAVINFYASKFPLYIVGIGFLLLTLLVELPVVYCFLKEDVANKKRLFVSIAAVNGATTLMVGVMERILCRGSW